MKSGSMKKCKSASGLYDMSGNVSEWTEGQRVFGGYYASDEDDAKCSRRSQKSEYSPWLHRFPLLRRPQYDRAVARRSAQITA